MGMSIFKMALEISDSFVTIGGGEPLLHPLFWEFVLKALDSGRGVKVITNGKKAEGAIMLAAMGKTGRIHAHLSIDNYHEKIFNSVWAAFAKMEPDTNDKRKIIGSLSPARIGRAVNFEGYTYNFCCCEETMIYPNGDIYGCGCKSIKFGTVDEPAIPAWHHNGCCATLELMGGLL